MWAMWVAWRRRRSQVTAPEAASAASFQPSKAATITGRLSRGCSSQITASIGAYPTGPGPTCGLVA